MKKSNALLNEISNVVNDVHRNWLDRSRHDRKYNEATLRQEIEKSLARFLYRKTERKPVIQIGII